MNRIAFLGLGNMGSGMALSLLGAGYALTVFNRTAARAEPLVRRGARLAASPREACDGADAIIAMTADDDSSRATWLGEHGVLAGEPNPAAFAVECSTLSHDWVAELSRAAAARGLRYIDSPVTGLPDAAAAGALTLFVGAAPADLEAVRPLLSAISERVLHFGAPGAGTAYKLLVNLLGAIQIASAAESMALAERAGLDLSLVAAALATGQAGSPQVVRNTGRIAKNDHGPAAFTPKLRLKDVDYALRLGQKLGLDSEFGRVAEAAFRRLCELGYADQNESHVVEVFRGKGPIEGA
jgi:3-hydroxyisobutyrate dehydrogenase